MCETLMVGKRQHGILNPSKNQAFFNYFHSKLRYQNRMLMQIYESLRDNSFACLFSVHNTISLTRHEQVCSIRLRFKRFESLLRFFQ